jgi:hypothetical protein
MQDPYPKTVNPLEAILPEWSLPTLPLIQWVLVGLLGLWLLLQAMIWSRRRSLGLRSLERASRRGLDAASYQTDMDAHKEDVLARGDDYAAERSRAEEPAGAAAAAAAAAAAQADNGWAKWISFARIGTLVAASLNLGITLIAAVAAGGEVNEMVESISFSDRWEAVMNKYWIGIAVAAVIVLLELGRWFSRRRTNPPTQQPTT